mgnify:CR=1 FL=1
MASAEPWGNLGFGVLVWRFPMSGKKASANPNPITTSLDPLEVAAVLEPETPAQEEARKVAEDLEAEAAKKSADLAAAKEAEEAERALAKKPVPPKAAVTPAYEVQRDQTISWGLSMKRLRAGDIVSDEHLGTGACAKLREAGVSLKLIRGEDALDEDFN